MTIGQKVKAFRLSIEMTQREVAVFLGVSLATIERLESGRNGSDLTRAKIKNRLINFTGREPGARAGGRVAA